MPMGDEGWRYDFGDSH